MAQQPTSNLPKLFTIKEPDWQENSSTVGISDLLNAVSPEAGATSNGDSFANLAGALGPNGRAPTLVRSRGQGPINVHDDFRWTASQADPARQDLPFIRLTEKVVNRSSRLQNLMYNTFALSQTPVLEAAATAVGAGLGAQAGAAGGNALTPNGGFGTGWKNKLKSAFASIGLPILGAATGGYAANKAVSYVVEKAQNFLDSGEQYNNQLSSYSGLYSTTPTGFTYKLPFVKAVGSIEKNISMSWSTENESAMDLARSAGEALQVFGGQASGALGSLLGGVGKGAGLAASIGGALRSGNEALKYVFAGAFTEQANSFSYGYKNEFDVTFYLFNNITFSDTVKNWQFLFALQYQNLPNRLNRLILTPPVIYEVEVPGYFYSMYTSISDIDVTFLGSHFLVDMPVVISRSGGGEVKSASTGSSTAASSTTYKVVVPEAYKVTLKFKNLLPETQNLFYTANKNYEN